MAKRNNGSPSRPLSWHTTIHKNHNGFWMTEQFTPHERHSHHIKKVIVEKKTKFQKATIVESSTFGRALILDDELQSAQTDEFIYHEALIHPSLTLHPKPQTVLILGGGEGATLRETLRHQSVLKATMVDIDGEVVGFAKKYLPSWHQNIFNNPRAHVVIDDAKNQVEKSKNASWDVIVSDLPTPVAGGPAQELYTASFYRKLKQKLSPNGLFVLQAGSGSLIQIDFHLKLYKTLTQVFPLVCPYYAFVPSYDVPWAFYLALQHKSQDPRATPAKTIDSRLNERRVARGLKFYDGQAHVGLFHVPKYIRSLLKAS